MTLELHGFYYWHYWHATSVFTDLSLALTAGTPHFPQAHIVDFVPYHQATKSGEPHQGNGR